MPVGMPPPGYADQMRQSGQMGGASPGGAYPMMGPGGPHMMGPGGPMGGDPGGAPGTDEQIKMMLALILQILTGAHNGGPPQGSPGMPGQSPGMQMPSG